MGRGKTQVQSAAPYFTFEVTGLSQKLRVSRFSGFEKLSALFQFDVIFVSDDNEIAFEDMVGKTALLSLQADDGNRYVHGVVSDLEQGAEGKKLASYRATLVPEAWRLTQKQNFRIFQEKSAAEIIEQVLDEANLTDSEVKVQLQGSYRSREYCVQYRESDWAFINRLMEEEGIYYFFEHSDGGHALVIADATTAHAPISGEPNIIFREPGGVIASSEHINYFRMRHGIRPDKVAMQAYNFKKPDLDLKAEGEGADDPALEIYEYPGLYDVPADGANLTKAGLERWQSGRKQALGESRVVRFTTGHLFTLADHPRGDFNAEYMLTRIEHTGSQAMMGEAEGGTSKGYENRFLCMPSNVPFRPPRRNAKPTINGVQTAIVVGPAGEEIHTDEHGRIKVQFHWDREGKKDEHSSCWVRVAQASAGSAWGSVFIPRIGHEVVVTFLEGDPDRPLVVGSVYHGTNVPPYGLPTDKTKSTIKTNSSPGGEGFNELRFEDKKGSEEIFIHGQKDWNITILNDKTEDIGNDQNLHVVANRTKKVDKNQTATIGGDKNISVDGDHTEKIGGGESLAIGGSAKRAVKGSQDESIGKDRIINVDGSHTESISKAMTISVADNLDVQVDKHSTEVVTMDKKFTISGDLNTSVEKSQLTAVTKDQIDTVDGEKQITVGKKVTLECGDVKITVEKNGKVKIESKDLTVKCDGPIKVEGKKLKVKSGGAVNVEASGAVQVKGSGVNIN